MKKLLAMLSLILINSSVSAQLNIVQNCDFETFDSCPDNAGQIERCNGWKIFSQPSTTPDYFNTCDTTGLFAPPNGLFAHQSAHSGNAYSAIFTFWPNNYREYIGHELLQPMIIGQKYFVSFYSCMGEQYANAAASNKLGVRFSTVPFNMTNPCPTNNWAHVYSDSIITDSINWTPLSWDFIADSNYQYLIIGNFFDNANTDTIKFASNCNGSYYLIDDVCVSSDSTKCQCSNVGISTLNYDEVTLYPNPITDILNISLDREEDISIELYSILGTNLFIENHSNVRKVKVNLSLISHGFYVISLNFKRSNKILKRKILKI